MAKIVYTAPLKALALEKMDAWSRLFPDKTILQLTGDTLTNQKIRNELMEKAKHADILVMTCELLDSVTRNFWSEQYQWVKDVELLIADEAHGVTMPGRGHVIEVSIMRFCQIAPQAKVWFLSATMPNCEQFAQWLQTLNNKPSEIINSQWRPTTLHWHFEAHSIFGTYWENQADKIERALRHINEHQHESTLVFVHDKNTGRRIKSALDEREIRSDFYNADLELDKRKELLAQFESNTEDGIKILISTSALAWGCNTSAQNAIIVGVNRGMDQVDSLDIIQMAGRCVEENSMILMADGTYQPAHTVNVGDEVFTVNKSRNLEKQHVLKIFKNKKNAKLIHFSNGTKITVSDHPLLTWNDKWISSDEIQIGDKISIITNIPTTKKPSQLYHLIKSELLHLDFDLRIRLSNSNDVQNLHRLISTPDHLEKPTYKTLKTNTTNLKTAIYFEWDTRFIRSKNGSEFDLATLHNNNQFLWLLGMMATDGRIRITKTCTKWTITQTNDLIFNQIVKILNDLGLKNSISQRKPPLGFITNVCELSNFPLVKIMERFGFTPKKTKTLSVKKFLTLSNIEIAHFLQGVIDGDGNIQNNGACRIYTASKNFAFELKEMLLKLKIRSNVKRNTTLNKLSNQLNDGYTIHFGKEGVNQLNTFASGFKTHNNTTLKRNTRPLKGETFYTRVTKIEEIKDVNLINFSVADTNTFIVEDIITHNCGRFSKAPIGNVFLICDNVSQWKKRIENPRDVTSTLLDTHALAFHLCAEIKNQVITNHDTLYTWYNRTLASIQDPLTNEMIEDVLRQLENWNAIKIEYGDFKITSLGQIAATLYFHPEDVHHWFTCFRHIHYNNLWDSDVCLAYALSAPNYQLPYIQRNELESVQQYFNTLRPHWRNGPPLRQSTLPRDVHDQLSGQTQYPSMSLKTFQNDADRIISAINWACGIAHIPRFDALMVLPIRLKYGISKDLVQLVQLPGVGKVRAQKLSAMGITSWEDVIKNPTKVQKAVGQKGLNGVIQAARMLLRQNRHAEEEAT